MSKREFYQLGPTININTHTNEPQHVYEFEIYDVEQKEIQKERTSHVAIVSSETVKIYKIPTMELIRDLNRQCKAVKYSNDLKLLVGIDAESGNIIKWDPLKMYDCVEEESIMKRENGADNWNMDIIHDLIVIVSGSSFLVVNTIKKKNIGYFKDMHSDDIRNISFVQEEQALMIYTSGVDGLLQSYSIDPLLNGERVDPDDLLEITISVDDGISSFGNLGKFVYIVTDSQKLTLWEKESAMQYGTTLVPGQFNADYIINAQIIHHNDEIQLIIAVGSTDGNVFIADVKVLQGETRFKGITQLIKPSPANVETIWCAQDMSIILTGDHDSLAALWENCRCFPKRQLQSDQSPPPPSHIPHQQPHLHPPHPPHNHVPY